MCSYNEELNCPQSFECKSNIEIEKHLPQTHSEFVNIKEMNTLIYDFKTLS